MDRTFKVNIGISGRRYIVGYSSGTPATAFPRFRVRVMVLKLVMDIRTTHSESYGLKVARRSYTDYHIL